MVNDIVGIFTLALVITGLYIALRPGSQLAQDLTALFNGFSKVQSASYGG